MNITHGSECESETAGSVLVLFKLLWSELASLPELPGALCGATSLLVLGIPAVEDALLRRRFAAMDLGRNLSRLLDELSMMALGSSSEMGVVVRWPCFEMPSSETVPGYVMVMAPRQCQSQKKPSEDGRFVEG
jgi:hypothetical protein